MLKAHRLYIKNKLDAKNIESTLNDSEAEPPNSLVFSINTDKYEIKWGDELGNFVVNKNEELSSYSSDEKMLTYIDSVIKQTSNTNRQSKE